MRSAAPRSSRTRRSSELAAGRPCLQIDYAEDGREALAKLARRPADLVITDLLMPEINGLQLVAAMREKYPRIPVILMTSQGSEEIAVQALQQGAASYVPKKLLLRYLWETIAKVLKAAVQDRGQARLIAVHAADREHLPPGERPRVVRAAGALLARGDHSPRRLQPRPIESASASPWKRPWPTPCTTAISRSPRNCGTRPGYRDLIRQRRSQSPYQERRIEVEARITRSEAAFAIRDEGAGFDPAALPDPTDPANIEMASGRGIFLMRAFMDEVLYNDVGNAVVLVKRRGAQPSDRAP